LLLSEVRQGWSGVGEPASRPWCVPQKADGGAGSGLITY
jgi:hypothetical protein